MTFNTLRCIIPPDCPGLLLCDMDDCLVDSAELTAWGWCIYLAEHMFNGNFTAAEHYRQEIYFRHRGSASEKISQEMGRHFPTVLHEVHDLIARRVEHDPACLPVNTATVAALQRLHRAGYVLGVLTHSTHTYARVMLTHMGRVTGVDVTGLFAPQLILGVDNLNYGHKPDGKAYQRTNQHYTLLNPQTPKLTVDDSPGNFPGAKQAGFTTIHVGTHTRGLVPGTVDFHIPTFADITTVLAT